MPRPRTPTEVLELRGAFKKDPQRKRPVGPKSDQALGQAPDYFSDVERTCWAEIEKDAPAGVLTANDRWAVEIATRLMAKFRTDWLTGAEFGQMNSLLGRLGKTPADRSKINVEQPKQEDEFAEFYN